MGQPVERDALAMVERGAVPPFAVDHGIYYLEDRAAATGAVERIAMSSVVDRARSALQAEGGQLMGMFKSTLTFTITYSIVAEIVKTRVEIVGLLLPTALIAVMATLMAQSHLAEIAKRADNSQVETMARAAASAVSSLSQVAVQFTSNLVALGLSEVISNSRDTAWVLWFVLVAIGMLYAAAEVLNGAPLKSQ